MFDYVYLGPAPSDENCAQLGQEGFEERARREIRAYMNQINRFILSCGKAIPEGCRIVRKTESHDFGTYSEVAVRYDIDDEKSVDFAFWLESNVPQKWDTQAFDDIVSS